MTYFLLIAYLKMIYFYYFHGFMMSKIIVMTCFLLITYLKMTYFYYFCGFVILWNNHNGMFFINCVFEHDIFMYVLLYHLYQPRY